MVRHDDIVLQSQRHPIVSEQAGCEEYRQTIGLVEPEVPAGDQIAGRRQQFSSRVLGIAGLEEPFLCYAHGVLEANRVSPCVFSRAMRR